MTVATCCKKTLCGQKYSQVYALACITALVVLLNYLLVRPWEILSLEVFVHAQGTLLWLLGILQVIEVVSYFCCAQNRPKTSIHMCQYVLGILFLTASIDGFIHGAHRSPDTDQRTNKESDGTEVENEGGEGSEEEYSQMEADLFKYTVVGTLYLFFFSLIFVASNCRKWVRLCCRKPVTQIRDEKSAGVSKG